MKQQQLYSHVRRALDDYQMIQENDHIAIGVSGGKDSLTLLYALAGIRRFYPKPFALTAVCVDLGFGEMDDYQSIQMLCDQLQVPFRLISTQIGQIVFEERAETSPCSLCAKMRKGALNAAVLEMGCNKVAYAHHMDDVIETMLLSLMYEGRFYSFAPLTVLDDTKLTILRPLMYVSEADVIGFQRRYELPVIKNRCPADGVTRRAYVKQLLAQINRDNPGVKKRLFHAIVHGSIPDWEKMHIPKTS